MPFAVAFCEAQQVAFHKLAILQVFGSYVER